MNKTRLAWIQFSFKTLTITQYISTRKFNENDDLVYMRSLEEKAFSPKKLSSIKIKSNKHCFDGKHNSATDIIKRAITGI